MADKNFKVKTGLDLPAPLPVEQGGTGQTTQANVINALLPVQTGNTGKYLSTDGTNTTWAPAASAENASFTGHSLVLPSGDTASRPESAATGAMRFNTDLGLMEFYTGTAWSPIIAISQPPTSASATDVGTSRALNDAAASVSFSAPSINGGSAVTSYTAISNPGNITQSGTGSPIVVTGLTSDTSYSFNVTASNAIGVSANSTTSDSIIATSVPDVPTSPSATNNPSNRPYNNGSASVAFIVPSLDGGKNITSYTAISSPGSYTGTATSTPVIVNGLLSNTNYTFTVKATNDNGDSLASTSSNSITATTVPQAPTVGTISSDPTSATGMVVPFTANNNGGSAITLFTAISSPGSITGTSTSSPIIISGLSPNTSYSFRVSATNANGVSELSSTSNTASTVTPTSYELIDTMVLSGNNTTYSNIPQDYKYLILRGYGHANTGYDLFLKLRFNSDSNSNYSYNYIDFYSSTLSTRVAASDSSIYLPRVGSNHAGFFEIIIPNYSTTQKKNISIFGGQSAVSTNSTYIGGAVYRGTSPITSITFSHTTPSGLFEDAYVSIIGVKDTV